MNSNSVEAPVYTMQECGPRGQGAGQGTVHTRDRGHTRDRDQGRGQFTPGTGSRAGDSSHQGQGAGQGTVHTRDR